MPVRYYIFTQNS